MASSSKPVTVMATDLLLGILAMGFSGLALFLLLIWWGLR